MPIATRTLKNNNLENTVVVFTLLACLGAWKARHQRGWLLLSGAAIVCAFLSKGPVGLYPLAAVAILPIVMDRDFLRGGTNTLICLAVVALCTTPLWFAEASQSLSSYWQQQVQASLTGQQPVVFCANAQNHNTLMAYLQRYHGLRYTVLPGNTLQENDQAVCAGKPLQPARVLLDLSNGLQLWQPTDELSLSLERDF